MKQKDLTRALSAYKVGAQSDSKAQGTRQWISTRAGQCDWRYPATPCVARREAREPSPCVVRKPQPGRIIRKP